MSLMLSLPDDWDYTLKGLAKLCCDGVDSVRNAVVQLETEGYIMRRQGRDAHGRLSANEYVVYEVPQPTKPVSDLPLSETQQRRNRQRLFRYRRIQRNQLLRNQVYKNQILI
jgi:hypothetical protein